MYVRACVLAAVFDASVLLMELFLMVAQHHNRGKMMVTCTGVLCNSTKARMRSVEKALSFRLTTRRLFSKEENDLYLSAKVDVIAHRGASGYMPDHTLPT